MIRPPKRGRTLAAPPPLHLPSRAFGLYCLLAVALVASGCQRKIGVPDGLEGAVDPTTEIGANGNVCGLLTTTELQLALNSPVGELQRGGRPIVTGMRMCYTLGANSPSPKGEPGKPKISGADVDSLAVWGLLRRSGEKAFRAYERSNEEHLEPMEVAGHEALWDERLRTLAILVDGNQVLGVRLKVPNPPVPKEADGAERRAYVKRVAQLLALRALQRFD